MPRPCAGSAGAAGWLLRYARMYLRPRLDGRPG
jgi:hypothetical protein